MPACPGCHRHGTRNLGQRRVPVLRHRVRRIGRRAGRQGGHVWAKAVALYDDQGHISGAIEAIRDVTDRHSAETALRESEEKFRRIIETAYEGIWVFDADFHTSFVNQRMADMLGYPPDAMLGKKFDAFVPDGSLEEKIIQQKRRHPPGQGDVFEHSITRKDGNTLWVLISASPLYDGDGRYLGALGMFTDITARKEIEKELHIQRRDLEAQMEARTRDLRLQALELAEANIRMSELDRLKSAFLSTVSHELRTPLTSILGFAKLIGREFGEHFLPLVGDNPLLAGKGKRIAENLAVVFHDQIKRDFDILVGGDHGRQYRHHARRLRLKRHGGHLPDHPVVHHAEDAPLEIFLVPSSKTDLGFRYIASFSVEK